METKWKLNKAQPKLFDDESAFYISYGNMLAKRDLSGNQIWHYEITGKGLSPWKYSYNQNTFILGLIGNNGAEVIGIDRSTGNERFHYTFPSGKFHNRIASISVVGDTVIAGADATGQSENQRPKIVALSASNGTVQWEKNYEKAFIQGSAGHSDRIYIALNGIRALDVVSGKETKYVSTTEPLSIGASNAQLYTASGTAYSFDLPSLSVNWKVQLPAYSYHIHTTHDAIFVGTKAGHILKVDPRTGKQMWQSRANAKIQDQETSKNVLWCTDNSGYIFGFSLKDGRQVARISPEQIGWQRWLAVIDQTILVGNNGGTAFEIKTRQSESG